MGRKITSPKGPRIIDIDILLAEDTVCRSQELEIPHPRMQERMFVLVPLKEIAPDVVHPVFKKQIEDLWRKNKDSSTVRIFQ
jgi:7,8-dihydro-6-hydroxymethylpterin-pyrophosphokinase